MSAGSFPPFLPAGRPRQISLLQNSGISSKKEITMDKVKSVYGYAVDLVAAHPAATVNAIVVVVVLKAVLVVL
jgi:hypothetical protein